LLAYAIAPPVAFVLVLAYAVALALYLSPRGRPAAPYVLGVGLTVIAVFAGALLLLLAGCGGSNGHVDSGVWAGGAAIFLTGGAWAIRRPSRVWWALPLSMLVASGFVVGLAVVLTGSTGACPD
jgi:hypothetical protein